VQEVIDSSGEDMFNHVEVSHQPADDFTGIGREAYDTVFLGSVIQYFPSASYLLDVLTKAVGAVNEGRVYIADVHCLQMREAILAGRLFQKAPDSRLLNQLLAEVNERLERKDFLYVDFEFFAVLAERLDRVRRVEIRYRRGTFDNQPTNYHWDVILHVGKKDEDVLAIDWAAWDTEAWTVNRIRDVLGSSPEVLAFSDVPNARTMDGRYVLQRLRATRDTPATVNTIREDLERQPRGVDPETLWQLGEDLGYIVDIAPSKYTTDATMDVVFRAKGHARAVVKFEVEAAPATREPLSCYVNNPGGLLDTALLIDVLAQHLRSRLPEYMVPSYLDVLDKLPLSPNGKIDRKALPDPSGRPVFRSGGHIPPRTDEEKTLSRICGNVLRVDQVGVTDDLFHLGADSMLVFQISVEAQDAGVNVSPRFFFQNPTIRGVLDACQEEKQSVSVGGADHVTGTPPTRTTLGTKTVKELRTMIEGMSQEEVRHLLQEKRKQNL
jgi:hypothetical protein